VGSAATAATAADPTAALNCQSRSVFLDGTTLHMRFDWSRFERFLGMAFSWVALARRRHARLGGTALSGKESERTPAELMTAVPAGASRLTVIRLCTNGNLPHDTARELDLLLVQTTTLACGAAGIAP
jgi:hypothetical protein